MISLTVQDLATTSTCFGSIQHHYLEAVPGFRMQCFSMEVSSNDDTNQSKEMNSIDRLLILDGGSDIL